jgi:hypothetical protein
MIKGFWHIALMGNWYSVVSNQLRIMLYSGLYNECSIIKIGCIGSQKEKDYLERFIVNLYPKLKTCYYSPNLNEYEFPTLGLIEKDKDEYKGFYIHTKGVSKPNDTCTAHWGAWMNESILGAWKYHHKNLYQHDMSGVNWLDTYYSGNFFWFRSSIVQTLPKLSTLNKKNRYEAEHWFCGSISPERCFKGAFKECGLGRDSFLINY